MDGHIWAEINRVKTWIRNVIIIQNLIDFQCQAATQSSIYKATSNLLL